MEANMRIKQRVKTEFNLSPRQIHMEERTKLMLKDKDGLHFKLDSYSKARSRLHKCRQTTFPKAPKQRSHVEVIGEWRQTLDKSENFLLADDGNDDKIMIFGTHSNLQILCNANYVISDGTFSIHPKIFSQLFVFHAPYLGKVLPLIFCLLPDKTYNTYCRLLRLMKEVALSIGSNFSPRKMHIDFEISMIKAVSDVFSENCVQGCLFHYSQCIWRKVQDLGLASAYKNNSHIRRWIRRFSALPFLPISDIDQGFIEIHESAPYPSNEIKNDQIEGFHDYMLSTWVHDTDALFKRDIWNHYENDGPRTTNNAEGWHNKLNRGAQSRMSFFQFVHFLQKLQVDLDATKMDLISSSPSRRLAKYMTIDINIKVAKENNASRTVSILNYLDCVSVALKLD